MATRLLTFRNVMAMTDLSCSAVDALMADSRFPQPIRVGSRAVRWVDLIHDGVEVAIAFDGSPIRSASDFSQWQGSADLPETAMAGTQGSQRRGSLVRQSILLRIKVTGRDFCGSSHCRAQQ